MFTSATTKSQMHKRPSKNIRNIPLHYSLAGASQMLHMQFLLYLGDSHDQQFTSTNITRRITGSSIRCPNLTVNKGGFPQVCQNVLQWASLIPMLRMTTPQTVHRCQLAPLTAHGQRDILTPYHFAQMLGRSLCHTGISAKMHKVLYRYFHCWSGLTREVPATWLLCEFLLAI